MLNVGELVAYLTLDNSGLVKGMNESEQEAKKTAGKVETALTSASRGADKLGRSAADAGRDVGKLGRGASDVEKVGQSAKRSADDVGKIGTAAQGAAQKLTGLAGQVSERAGSAGGSSFVSGFSSKLGDLGGKGGPVAASLVGVAAVGLAAGALLARAIQDGMAREAAMDLNQAKLGVDEATMRRIGHAAADAFGNAFGESTEANMDTIRRAMQAGVIDKNASTAGIQATVEGLDTISTLLDGDVASSIKAVSALMTSGLAKDSKHALDIIAAGADGSANKADDLLETVSEYSAGWKQAGFSAEFAMGLIEQATDKGVDNSDRAGDAIREFGRRMYEEAPKIQGAIGELGLPVDELFNKLKAGGTEGEAAFDLIFDAIRRIPDPAERAAVAQQLLGDTAGDFIGTFAQWDPSEASRKFGDVGGAAQKAADTIGGGAQAKITGALNSISTAGDDLKLALAEGFGPGIERFADWVTDNKPQLIEFFTGLANAALVGAEGILRFVQMSLNAIGPFVAVMGEAIGSTIQGMSNLVGAAGKIADALGMDGMAEDLRGAATGLDDFGAKTRENSGALLDLADKVGLGADALGNIRGEVLQAGEAAANSEVMMKALGKAVVQDVPDTKSIVITDNSPETIRNLEALGFKVENTPSGIKVTAATGEAETIIGDFLSRERSMTVWVDIQKRRDELGVPKGVYGPVAMGNNADGSVMAGSFANGKLPNEALIQSPRSNLVQWAEPETEGEAFIPMARSKRSRSASILQDVATKFGFGLVKMADGGLLADELEQRAQGIEGAEYVFGGWGDGWNTDCTGAASRLANMAAYGDPEQGGRFATGNAGPALASRGFLDGPGPDGSLRVGWLDDPGGPGGGHAASTLPDGTNVEMGGNRGNGQFGGQAAGADQFPNIMHYPMVPSVGVGTSTITGDGSGEFGPRGPRGGKSGMDAGTTDSGVSLSTDGQRVFVTNWPSQLGGDKPEEREPRLTAGLNVYANGGEDHSAQIAGAGAMRLWAEPETGGEAYIPLGANKRPRSLALTKQVASRFGYTLVPMAEGGIGFGGYSGPDTDDPMQPKNWYQSLALASGLGFTALSALGPYMQMAQSGQVDLSELAPKFDTSSNSIPGAAEAIGAITDRIDELIAAAKDGKPVNLQVTVDSQSGGVDVEFMRKGL